MLASAKNSDNFLDGFGVVCERIESMPLGRT